MALEPLSHEQFLQLQVRDRYFRGRWVYMKPAGELVRRVQPERVLEIGPMGARFVPGSDTLDVVGTPTYRHDATRGPWPMESDAYDLVVALQVFEHLGGGQRRAFAEALRVAPNVILSFPYMWTRGADAIHRGITKKKISRWTHGHAADVEIHVKTPRFKQRLVCLYRRAT